jgi:hypothetical protein
LYLLDDMPVQSITSYLTSPGKAASAPLKLTVNASTSFAGSYVLGMGFVLEPEEAQALIDKNPNNQDVLFPYLNGEDLNNSPYQAPSRWVINFFDWSLERAEQYSDLLEIVREKVKPERDRNKYSKSAREKWWQYERSRPELYATIAGMERVLVKTQVSRTWAFSFVKRKMVYDQRLIVFAIDTCSGFAVLQSEFHWIWATAYASTLKQDMSYTPTNVFETFPFPDTRNPIPDTLNTIGEQYHEHRRQVMLTRQEGLTKTYNRFHDPEERAEDIALLRRLHTEMDAAVAAAYGWHDLDLGHGFHATKQGTRYTISEAARREVLDRLLALNHERYAEEVAAGLHEKGKGKAKKGTGRKGKQAKGGDAEQGELL